jgi:phosphate transport system substrate-binding protein
MSGLRGGVVVAAGVSALACSAAAQNGLPGYVPARQVSGVIRTWGSPQMGDLLKLYEAGFHAVQPQVQFEDDLKSTITAVAGVYTGRAEIGLLGREIWPVEEQAFASIEGHAPRVIEVATGSYDVPKATFALMVFVPRANPLANISMQQLARVFGGGSSHAIHTWGELGLKGEWAWKPIHLYGFSRDNDKAQIFSKLVFAKGETWDCGLHEFANAADGTDAGELIVRAVESDPDAIGISNVHYATAGVRALAIEGVAPLKASVADRSYPLSRAVYIVVDRDMNEATAEFLRFVLSRQGQDAVVREANYLPLTEEIAQTELRELPGGSRVPH